MSEKNPLIHDVAVALFAGFKRTAQAGGNTTTATWADLEKNPNLKRIMYSLAHDALKAVHSWGQEGILLPLNLQIENAITDADAFEQLMRKPL